MDEGDGNGAAVALFVEDRKSATEAKGKKRRKSSKIGNPAEGEYGKSTDELVLEEEVFGRDLGELDAIPESFVSGETETLTAAEEKRKAVWLDQDDDKVMVSILSKKRLRKLRASADENVLQGSEYVGRLQEFHRKVVGTRGAWASLDSSKSERIERIGNDEEISGDVEADGDSALDALKRSTKAISTSRMSNGPVPDGILDISRLRNANAEESCRSVVTTVQFHPKSPTLLVGGLDKTVRLFHIDGEKNPRLHGFHLSDLPIHTARYTRGGSEVIIAGERKVFYQFDVVSATVAKISTLVGEEEKNFRKFRVSTDGSQLAFLGHNGRIFLLSASSKQKMGFLKMNAHVRDVAFANDDRELLSVGLDGKIYRWDLRMGRCLERMSDEGSVKGTAIGVSPRKGLYACGSDSGVLNLYGSGQKGPRKAFMNLTTPLDGVEFSSDGELCLFYSNSLKSAFRVAHTGAATVFSNWPTEKTNLRRVYSASFSQGNGFLATGNDKGIVCLFRLNHYAAK